MRYETPCPSGPGCRRKHDRPAAEAEGTGISSSLWTAGRSLTHAWHVPGGVHRDRHMPYDSGLRTYSSTAYRNYRASLARGKLLFLRAISFRYLGTYCRRAVLGLRRCGPHWFNTLILEPPGGVLLLALVLQGSPALLLVKIMRQDIFEATDGVASF